MPSTPSYSSTGPAPPLLQNSRVAGNPRPASPTSGLTRANTVLGTESNRNNSPTGGMLEDLPQTSRGFGIAATPASIRDKAELRNLVQRNEKFAQVLEETTNTAMSKIKPNVDAGQVLKFNAEFMWKSLLLMWEVEGTLDEHNKMHPKQIIEQLKEENELFRDDLDDCRRSYLKELTAMRDQIRVLDERQLQHIKELVYGTGQPDEQPVMFYEPTRYLPDNLRHFVAEVVEEKLKLLLFRIAEDEQDPVERERRRSMMQMAADAQSDKEKAPTEREKALEQQVVELEELAKAYATELENIGAGMNNFAKDSKKNEQSAAVTRIEHNIQACKLNLSRHHAAKDMVQKKLDMRTKQLERQAGHLEQRRKEGADPSEIMQLSQAVEEIETEIKSLKEELSKITEAETTEKEELQRHEEELEMQLKKEEEDARRKEEADRAKEQAQQEKDMALMAKEKELEEARKLQQQQSSAGGKVSVEGGAGSGAGAANAPVQRQDTILRNAVGKMLPKPGSTFKQYRTKMLMIRAVMSSMHQGRKEALQKCADLEIALEAERSRAEQAIAEMERMAMKMFMANARKKGMKGNTSDVDSDTRKSVEDKVRKEMQAEMDKLKKQLADGEGSEAARRKQEDREKELLEIIRQRDEEIKRLKAEIEKLQAALQELQMQIEALLADPKKAREGALAMRKKLGEQLNWVVKNTHENVFDRLYHDAIDRLTRMEVLRQTFMKMQREQLVDLIQYEDDMGHLKRKQEKAEQQAAYQIYLADELAKLRKEQKEISQHNRWGNSLTDGELLKRAREQLDTLYPMGVPTQLPETIGPRVRPISGPSGTFTSERDRPLTVDDLHRYPVHNNFMPGVANFGPLDFRETAQKFSSEGRSRPSSSGRPGLSITSYAPRGSSPPAHSPTMRGDTVKGDPGTNFGVIPQLRTTPVRGGPVYTGEELIWDKADMIRPPSASRSPRDRHNSTMTRGSSSPPTTRHGGMNGTSGGPDGVFQNATLQVHLPQAGTTDGSGGTSSGGGGGATSSSSANNRLMSEDNLLNAPISQVLQQFSYPNGAREPELDPNDEYEFNLLGQRMPHLTTSASNRNIGDHLSKYRAAGTYGGGSSGAAVPGGHGQHGDSSRGSTRPSTAGGNLSSAAPSRPYSAATSTGAVGRRTSMRWALDQENSVSGKFPFTGSSGPNSGQSSRAASKNRTGTGMSSAIDGGGYTPQLSRNPSAGHVRRDSVNYKAIPEQMSEKSLFEKKMHELRTMEQKGGTMNGSQSAANLGGPKQRNSAGPVLFYPGDGLDKINIENDHDASSPEKLRGMGAPPPSSLWAHSGWKSSTGGAGGNKPIMSRPRTAGGGVTGGNTAGMKRGGSSGLTLPDVT
ncbi:unnamed protein product [Amoebophrya sp. A120]|nr:unnamed protein product [Amoebophrya sp. A120]|eukprot:GSA120T00019886001.1